MMVCAKGEAEMMLEGPEAPGGAPKGGGRATQGLLAFWGPFASSKSPDCFSWWKSHVVFFLDFISCKNNQKENFPKKQCQILQFLFKYGEILGQNNEQRACKSRCILDASDPPSLACYLSSNDSNAVKKR